MLDPCSFTTDDELYRTDPKSYVKATVVVAHIYIYCAPCACQIHTAFDLCTGEGVSKHFDFRIRIDDQLVSSCCPADVGIYGLISVIQEIKEIERKNPHSRLFRERDFDFIDRPWIEKRIYDVEENQSLPRPIMNSSSRIPSIFTDHANDEKCASIVVLGEADHYASVMQMPPFLSNARMPRETEVFKMSKSYNSQENCYFWKRNYMGTYSPKIRQPATSQTATKSGTTLDVSKSTSGEQQTSGNPSVSSFLTRQTSPPPTPSVKRQRTSVSGSHNSVI